MHITKWALEVIRLRGRVGNSDIVTLAGRYGCGIVASSVDDGVSVFEALWYLQALGFITRPWADDKCREAKAIESFKKIKCQHCRVLLDEALEFPKETHNE